MFILWGIVYGVILQAQQNPRELRGVAIASTEGMIERIDDGSYRVHSQANAEISYLVIKLDHPIHKIDWKCECPDYRYRHGVCKHIHAVRFSQLLRAKAESKNFGFALTLDESLCISCGSNSIVKDGMRKNRTESIQRFLCKNCGYRFTVNYGFQKMKNSPKIITLVIDLYMKGCSYRKIVDHLQQFYELKVNASTVLRWIQKYTNVMKEFTDSLGSELKLSPVWHLDETLINIKDTEPTGKGFYSYMWTCMDSETRFLLACEVSKHRTIADGTKMLKKAYELADSKPMAIISDSYHAYGQIINDVFYTNTKPRPVHIKTKAIKDGMDNIRIERQFGELKDRTKVMRGIGNDDGAQILMDLHRINHNFVKKHMGLDNKTPAEIAGIDLPLRENKWLDLIRISTSHRTNLKSKSK